MREVLALVERHPGGLMVEAIARTLAHHPHDPAEAKAWREAAARLAAAGLVERCSGIGARTVLAPRDPAALASRLRASRPRPPGWR